MRTEYIRGCIGTSADRKWLIYRGFNIRLCPHMPAIPALRRQRSQVRILSGAPRGHSLSEECPLGASWRFASCHCATKKGGHTGRPLLFFPDGSERDVPPDYSIRSLRQSSSAFSRFLASGRALAAARHLPSGVLADASAIAEAESNEGETWPSGVNDTGWASWAISSRPTGRRARLPVMKALVCPRCWHGGWRLFRGRCRRCSWHL